MAKMIVFHFPPNFVFAAYREQPVTRTCRRENQENPENGSERGTIGSFEIIAVSGATLYLR